MSSERFARIREIILAAASLSPPEQAAYLDEACRDDPSLRREVDSILAHENDAPTIINTHGLAGKLADQAGADFLQEPEASLPQNVGPYRITGVLGEGGMGIVYAAQQTEPIRREVAVKLMRWGMDSAGVVARFEAERQTLALMDHPHIAKVLDAGADEQGRPYFVMERVRGVPITQYCAEQAADTQERVRLLLATCLAVQHAHQKGIIHRDLKPSNILVVLQDGMPEPRVIDFGIAKAVENSAAELSRLTLEGQPIGTLSYMSPEQARGATGQIDTRSDVYAMGAVMYELLAGVPYHAVGETSLLEQIRAVCEDEPRPFKEVLTDGRQLDSDLEIIVRKALAKDPAERYQSMSALAGDIERYRDSRPILARPPSTAYQLRKLVLRNRVPSAMVAGIVLMVVAFGIWMSVLFARSEANLTRALQAEGEAGQVSDFMVGLFEISHPVEARGNTVTVREILDRGVLRVEADLDEQPAVQARLMHTMGAVYGGLGIYDRSVDLLHGALNKQQQIGTDGGEDEAAVLSDLGRIHLAAGRISAADTAYTRALAIRRDLLSPQDPLVASALANVGWVAAVRGQLDTAEVMIADAVTIFTAHADPQSLEEPAALNSLAQVYQEMARYDEAESLYQRALALREERLPTDHPEIAASLNNLADLYWLLGRYTEAEPLFNRALGIAERILSPDHPELAGMLANRSALYKDLGDLEKAERDLLRALAIQERVLDPDHRDIAITLNNLGLLCREQGDLEAAEQALRRSLDIKLRTHGPGHPSIATALNNLGELKVDQNDFAEAGILLQRSIDIRTTAYGADDPRTSLPQHNLGLLRLEQGRFTEAESLLVHALEVREETLGPDHYRVTDSLEGCARLYRQTGRVAAAEELEARAAAARRR